MKALLLMLLIGQSVYSKVLIIVPVFNRPDFIEIQHTLFGKFLKDDYDLMMFNDADDDAMREAIEQTCMRLGITCIRVPQNVHNVDPNCKRAVASFRHGEVLQYAFDHFGYMHDDIVTIFDSDMFLIRELSIRNYLGDCDLNAVAVAMGDPSSYGICVHCSMLNMPKLRHRRPINFRAGMWDGAFGEPGHDGYDYFKTNKDLKIKISYYMQSVYFPEDIKLNPTKDVIDQLQMRGYSPLEIDLIQSIREEITRSGNQMTLDIGFYDENLLLDYKHGSGWHGPSQGVVETKNRIFRAFINSLIN